MNKLMVLIFCVNLNGTIILILIGKYHPIIKIV